MSVYFLDVIRKLHYMSMANLGLFSLLLFFFLLQKKIVETKFNIIDGISDSVGGDDLYEDTDKRKKYLDGRAKAKYKRNWLKNTAYATGAITAFQIATPPTYFNGGFEYIGGYFNHILVSINIASVVNMLFLIIGSLIFTAMLFISTEYRESDKIKEREEAISIFKLAIPIFILILTIVISIVIITPTKQVFEKISTHQSIKK